MNLVNISTVKVLLRGNGGGGLSKESPPPCLDAIRLFIIEGVVGV